jgi:hypothetical protein
METLGWHGSTWNPSVSGPVAALGSLDEAESDGVGQRLDHSNNLRILRTEATPVLVTGSAKLTSSRSKLI